MAGILFTDETLVLAGYNEFHEHVTGFGGKKKNNEYPYETAIREVVEELLEVHSIPENIYKEICEQITFDNVVLKFNGKVALKLINLKLEKDKITAFVGCSGSGKTSLSNLLVRFYNPTSGQILIDNYDIKDIKIDSLRRQISLVTQDTTLFDTSVTENIAYGKPNATQEQIIIAAKLADAHEFISHLPDQYNTIIGNQGSTLSGGQRQRLAIARAFLKDSEILIWDEATSSLDQNSEKLILTSLANLRKGKTTLIITHRLSSIKDVDHIVVMKSGMVYEQGTHEQLMQNKAEYYKLYNKELG